MVRHARTVGDRHRLVGERVEAPRRAQGVGELAPDLGDLRDRQEGGHRQQGQERQQPGIDRAVRGKRGADDDHRQAAEAGEGLEQGALGGQRGMERPP